MSQAGPQPAGPHRGGNAAAATADVPLHDSPGGLAHSVPQLRAEHSLEDAVRALGTTDREGIPVVDQAGHVIGWITHRQVFRAYLGANGTPVSQPALPRLTPTGPRDSNRLGN